MNPHKTKKIMLRQIMNHVDLYDLCRHYGYYEGPKAETFIFCPFHDETKPSARLYVDGLVWCFGCHKMYDILDFVMQIEDLTLNAASLWIQNTFEFKIKPVETFIELNEFDLEEVWKPKILALKGKIPFNDYLALWEAYDLNVISEDLFKEIQYRNFIKR